jgi:hypothetical protein
VKFTIDLGSCGDECAGALRQLFDALKHQWGGREAYNLWIDSIDYDLATWKAQTWLEIELREQRISLKDQRLLFEYHAKSSNRGLAKDLARRNGDLLNAWAEYVRFFSDYKNTMGQPPPQAPEAAPFGPRGTTSASTMMQHIKRVKKRHPNALAAIARAPIKAREAVRRDLEDICRRDHWFELCERRRAVRMRTKR